MGYTSSRRRLHPPRTRRRSAPAPDERPPRHTPISRARRAAPHRALRGARPVARPRRGGSGAHRRRARRGHLRRARQRLSRRVSEVAGLRQGIEPPRGRQSLGGRCPHPPPDLGVAATRRPEDPGGAGGRPVERRAGGVHPGGVARDPRRSRACGGAAPGSGRAGGDAGRDGGRESPDHRGEPARDVQPGEGLQEPAGGKRRKRAVTAGRDRGPARAQRGGEDHDLLHDDGARAPRRRPHRAGRPGPHRRPHVPPGADGDRLPRSGAVGVPQVDGGGEPPGHPGDPAAGRGGAGRTARAAARRARDQAPAPPTGLSAVGRRAPTPRDHPRARDRAQVHAAGRAVCRRGSHRRARHPDDRGGAATPRDRRADHRPQRGADARHRRPRVHHVRGEGAGLGQRAGARVRRPRRTPLSRSHPDGAPADAPHAGRMKTGLHQHASLQQQLRINPRLYQAMDLLYMPLLDLPPRQQLLAEEFIGNIAEDGSLGASLEEIARGANQLREEHAVESEQEVQPPLYTIAEAEEMLRIIQKLDPPGVGARDLRECLLLQLEDQKKTDTLAYRLVQEAFDDLKAHRWSDLGKRFGLDPAEVQKVADDLAKLDPKPGLQHSAANDAYIIPDLVVQKIDSEYKVFLNDSGLPRLRISRIYQDIARDKKQFQGENKEFINQRLNSAHWIIQAIEQRRQTMLKVMNFIVDRQREFFEKGVEYLKPLTLREVADVINMHESTVSRVTNEKYVQTPRGLLPLKFFFSSGLATTTGEDASARAIKAQIKKMVDEEDPKNPLTDQQIVELFGQRGVKIARRTVAKYRDQLGILPARMRKRL